MTRWLAVVLVSVQVTAWSAPSSGAGQFLIAERGGRAYRVYVPQRAVHGPLVVALHGCWQTPEDFARGTRLNDAGERRGLVVLYPQQERRDNVYRCWNWFMPGASGGAETAALLELTRAVRAERAAREPSVIVLGFSAGAFMAVNLACADPVLVAGVGVAAGGPYRCGIGPEAAIRCMRGSASDGAAAASACLAATHARALNVRASLWQGGADAVVNPANLAALETMFARIDGAITMTTQTREGAVWAVHQNARGAAVVEAWLVPAMGHAWSGGDARGANTWPTGPDATTHILDFLLGDTTDRPR